MARIQILSEETIDKIAAGEVVERPVSIVKELVENSIDAGADAITVEIKEGGISFIRITDNGSGIPKEDIRTAFYRHATSKITDASDLTNVTSLGFRGEALSSIAAIAQVELLTKTSDNIIGTKYVIEGSKEIEVSDVGVPNGTTIIVRNIFFNTPVRRKFLKSSITEGSYIAELCERLALSRPNVSIKFISGGQVKFHTSGSGDLKEIIYRIYGKDVASELIPINYESRDIKLNGYLGKPVLNRSTRNYENYFINGRYIKSSIIAHAVEDGYKQYLMQHKFPFFVMDIAINPNVVDVNVHPTKMDVRFSDPEHISDLLSSAVESVLKVREMIPESVLVEEKEEELKVEKVPEPFEENRIKQLAKETMVANSMQRSISNTVEKLLKEQVENSKEDTDSSANNPNSTLEENKNSVAENFVFKNITDAASLSTETLDNPEKIDIDDIKQIINDSNVESTDKNIYPGQNVIKASRAVIVNTGVQMNMFEDKMLTIDAMNEYKIIGQIFDTYWLIEYRDKLLVMDQHAAHEKVKYEALVKQLNEKQVLTQMLNPPIVVSLTPTENATLKQYVEHFKAIGFEIEEFGGNDINLRAVPMDLYGKEPKELFLEIMDELGKGAIRGVPEVINEKLASMACKSAVKGNNSMTIDEVKALLDQLMKLDNPYNCPHGRPTIFSMSKYEIEKKFKRIV